MIAFIGLGEAASAFLGGWGAVQSARACAYDNAVETPSGAAVITARAHDLGVRVARSPRDAVHGASLIFSTVTADQAIAAATAAAPHLAPGAIWCDLNSCAPQSKVAASAIVTDAGAHYLDVAVMAPVYPRLNMVPCLISGPQAQAVAGRLTDLPMAVRVVGDTVGRASSIKMVRSIMVKGLEALTAECVLAAAHAGVEDEVFASLASGHPQIDVPVRAAYNFERSLIHGQRRAAEMDEVAKMLAAMGLPDAMAKGSATWQRALSSTGLELPDGDNPDHTWFASEYLDRLPETRAKDDPGEP